MKFDTKVVRAGILPDPSTGAIVPPIYQSATYVLEEVGKDKGYDYTRAANPTREILENNLAALDGGKYGICFSSGMAAVDSVMKLLKAGDHVVCSDDVYGGVSRLYNNLIVNYEISFTYVNSSNPQEVEDAIKMFQEEIKYFPGIDDSKVEFDHDLRGKELLDSEIYEDSGFEPDDEIPF